MSSPAKATGNGKELAENRPYQQLARHLQGVAELDTSAVDGITIAQDVADKVAVAATVDDVFDALEQGLDSLKDTKELHGIPVDVFNVEWRKSDEAYSENSYGVFAIVDMVVIHNGEVRKISCGSPDVVGGLGKFQGLGAISEDKPLRLKFVAKKTNQGYERLTIARA